MLGPLRAFISTLVPSSPAPATPFGSLAPETPLSPQTVIEAASGSYLTLFIRTGAQREEQGLSLLGNWR